MKKNLIFSILTLALVFASCSKKNDNATQTDADKPNLVRVAASVKKDVPQTSEFMATVQPEAKNNIAAGTPGRIRKIFVETGDIVSKGQKLAQMDDANLANLQVQIENLKITYKRISELFAVGGISQQELDNVKLQLDVAETNFKTLQENTFLISPMNGIVTARYFDEGDLFAAGQYPLVTIMQISPVKIRINVPESYFTTVKKGMSVDVKFDVFENETFEGKVSLVYPTIDELTRSFTTEITLPNRDLRVRPGMFARVTLNFGEMNRVVISDKSVIKQQGTNDRYVYILNADNTVTYQKVILGNRVGNEYEVLSGVAENDKVVIAGISNLSDGQKVQIAE